MQSESSTWRAGLIVLMFTASPAADPADSNNSVEVSALYTSGNQNETSSADILNIPFFARFRLQPFTSRATDRFIRLNGLDNAGSGLAPIVQDRRDGAGNPDGPADAGPGATARRMTDSGLGNMSSGMTHTTIDGWAPGLNLDFGGGIKLATPEVNGATGTGNNDFSLQIDMDSAIGNFKPNAVLGHRWIGDSVALDSRSVWYGAAGIAYRLESRTSISLDFDYEQATVKTYADVRELTLGLSHQFTSSSNFRVYAIKGLSDGSADYGGGLRLSTYF